MKNRFICAEEVAQELSVSKSYAYKLNRQLNEELKAKVLITKLIANTVFKLNCTHN